MPAPVEPRRTPRLFGVLGFLAWLHLYLGGLFGFGIVAAFGPAYAMSQAVIAGDTEPVLVDLPLPWLAAGLTALLPIPWVVRRQWRNASLLTLPFTLVPVGHLVRLILAAQPR